MVESFVLNEQSKNNSENFDGSYEIIDGEGKILKRVSYRIHFQKRGVFL